MSTQEMRSHEFKVTIGRTLEGIEYPVHASSPAGSAIGVFVLPFSVDQIEQALQNFQQGIPGGRYRRTGRTRGEVQFDELSPEGFGSALFQALFSDEMLALYRKSLSMAGKPGVANRMPVKLNIMAWELACLPWELLYDIEKGEFLGFGQDMPVIRFVDREPRPPTFDPPLRILLVSAAPADTKLLDHERKAIGEALDTPIREDKVRIDYSFGATLRALRSKVREYEPHVIHFMGHGQVNHLLLEDRGREGLSLTESGLGIILRNAFSLRMVVFNACETARPPDDSERRLGLAHGLARREVPATIAMQFGISDEAAQEFVKELYQALAEGQPIDEAVLRGRIAIQNRFTDGMEWATPVLYMQTGEGQIFHDLLPMGAEFTYPRPEERSQEPVTEKESLEPGLKAWVHSYYEQGLRHFDESKWALALIFLEDVQRMAPTYKDVRRLVRRAREELAKQETERRTQEKLAALYRQALIHCDEERWQAAVDLFNEILDVDPNYKDVKVRAETVRRAHAQQLAEGQIRLHLATLYQRAQEHLAAEDWERAAELFEQVVSIDRDYADALPQLVRAQRGKSLAELYHQAEEAFAAQNWEQATANLGAVLAIDKSYKDVKAKLEQARQQQRWDAWYQEGLEYLEAERWDEAIEALREVQPDQKRRKDAEVARLYAEGRQYIARGEWVPALARFEEVVGENPQYRDAARQLQEARRQKRLHDLYTVGLEQAKAQEWRQAIHVFEQVAREAPDYRGVQSQLALVRGEAELAEHYASGTRFFDLGHWSEAIQEFQSIIKIRPDYPNAQRMLEKARRRQTLASHYVEGERYMADEHWDEASATFEKIMGIDPQYQDVKERLDEANRQKRLEAEQQKTLEDIYAVGVASLTAGAWEQAVSAFEEIIGMDADYRDARDLLRKAEQGRWADWKSRMWSSLQGSGRLTAHSLDYVPKRLRLDTMRRFYEEYSENLELVPSTDFQVLTLLNFDLVSDLRETWRAMLKAIQSEHADATEGKPAFWTRLKRGELFGSGPAKPFDILADELTDQLCRALGFVRTPDQDRQHKQLYARMISTPTLHYGLPPRSPLIIFAKQFVEAEDVRDLLDLMYILERTIGFAFLVTLGDADQLKTLLSQERVERDFVVLNRRDWEQILLSRDKAGRLTQTIVGQVSLTVISPYLVAGPVPESMFFGRREEIRTIRDNIRDINVALTGGRKIGKTSILRQVQRILTTQLDCKTFHLDCQAIDTPEIFNREFTKKLSDQFDPPPDLQAGHRNDASCRGPIDCSPS